MIYLRSLPPWLSTLCEVDEGSVCGKTWPGEGGIAFFEIGTGSDAVRVKLRTDGLIAIARRGASPQKTSLPRARASAIVAAVVDLDAWIMEDRRLPERSSPGFDADEALGSLEHPATAPASATDDAWLWSMVAHGRVTDAGEARATVSPRWARIVIAALRGDLGRLRAVLAEPDSGDGAFNFVAAAGLEQLGWIDPAIQLNEAALIHQWPAERSGVYARLARLAGQLAEREGTTPEDSIRWSRAAVLSAGDDARIRRIAAERMVRAGAFADARAVLDELVGEAGDRADRSDRAAVIALAHLRLWYGDHEAAAPLVAWLEGLEAEASEVEADPALPRLAGIVALRRGDEHEAEVLFRRALAIDADDVEAGLFLAEMLARRGERAAAVPILERSRARAENAAHGLLVSVAYGLHREDGPPEYDPVRDAEVFAELDRFAGNRGALLTRLDGDRLQSVPPGVAKPREASAGALRTLRFTSPSTVRAELDRLVDLYPESPHPHCYRGELWMWLGELDRAYGDFAAGSERKAARWAFVGRGAVHVLRGELDEAEREFAACARVFSAIPGATTHVFRGEGLRRQGRIDQAIAELETALTVKRGRVSAWVNLALCHLARKDTDAARPILERLDRQWPWLLRDAEGRLDATMERAPVETLEEALAMMRGNRSSHLITYFVRERDPTIEDPAEDVDPMRVLQDAERWRRVIQRTRTYARTELRNRVVDAVLART